MTAPPRILIVAGSDSGGGAGLQADLKTVLALGGYGMTAVTALTAQNTLGVHEVLPVPASFVRRQMRVVLDDLGADAVKTGMLKDAGIIAAVAEELPDGVPLVVDPVMVAKGGAALLDPDAIDALKRLLLPRTTVLTPNLPEAEALLGLTIGDLDGMKRAAGILLGLGPAAVLLKGGHLPGDMVHDVLADRSGIRIFSAPRIPSHHTHGTGCTLASALATGLGAGRPLAEAVARAREYVREAIRAAPGFGRGHGPLGHGHTVGKF
ncbi:MAG TPA: bifunctional hydroxymethylpyrimidine kinase/phosphomethylpyrimidine kinase [Aliidongia sp.]|uniref:bifunctional hydroxymethylpyrimidine kinase/phosphomethylpyrimidine kinase n=1 Tax=Aliidongia sp. TaxID=1914230 RepID=UPI002DDCCE91|nr:bifunctional hydroxymethylpyrimidine kinase/phosphomethylpyrimidine kinase [Aliidongia sp.]HEV2676633.1 bifunctional hydroxymethylpyrimidine kinase/phosphomethylpyrimidine kinase [Aliidongia sp.]